VSRSVDIKCRTASMIMYRDEE